jgi:methylmalonyl-CoA mutase N-terminal domain/subunit
MAAVLGGTQSLHTNSFDEALSLPTTQSATLALRTQQLLAHETGVPDVVDPLAGSWYLEALTDTLEREARTQIEEIEQLGGAVPAIERGLFQERIAASAYAQQREIEAGRQVVVGVNQYEVEEPAPSLAAPDYANLAAGQKQRVAAARAKRDKTQVTRALSDIGAAAREPRAALMEPILAAVRARATVGEISDTLRVVWGVYGAKPMSGK